jgi:hypothetical protein
VFSHAYHPSRLSHRSLFNLWITILPFNAQEFLASVYLLPSSEFMVEKYLFLQRSKPNTTDGHRVHVIYDSWQFFIEEGPETLSVNV